MIRPEIDEVKYILNYTFKDFRNIYFDSFEKRSSYDTNFLNIGFLNIF